MDLLNVPDNLNIPKDNYFVPVNLSHAKNVEENDIKLVYFNPEGKEVNPSELTNLPTKIFIHAWLCSMEENNFYSAMKDAYVKQPEAINVIYVDYSRFSKEKYSIAAATVPNIGKDIAKKLMAIEIERSNIHILAQSLGSHVAGFIGREIYNTTREKIARITLLDPAAGQYDMTSFRVNKNDAMFVDAIHTDMGRFGSSLCLGHVDIFPNGGKHQPGCPSLQTDPICSHARSALYYLESINKRPRVCKKAANWEDYQKGQFLDDTTEIFGEYISTQLEGQYYLVTNSTEPFFN